MSTVAQVEPESQALSRVPAEGQAGVLAMALMPDEEFEQRLAALKKGQERISRIKKELMEKDVHYGVIPGTDKPALLKPGSELLFSIYKLRPDFIPQIEYGDGTIAPPVRVTMRCEVHVGDLAGPVVGVGYGSANSWERKHRYRRGERTCPECGVVGSVIKGKENFGGGWICWAKRGGCGVKWPDGTAAIEQQAVGDIENQDQHDLENTLLKMAKKRSQIDGALTATASSDLFTQDIEETAGPPKVPPKASSGTRQPAPTEDREPGDDGPTDDELRDMGVEENPAFDAQAAESHRTAPPKAPTPAGGKMPVHAKCKSARGVMLSKRPEAGFSHYCRACGAGFNPGGQS